ncbi:MAG: hypothetical protein R6V06_04820 [Kiritimatiellia bacterium]
MITALLICGFSAHNLLCVSAALITVSWIEIFLNLPVKTGIAVNHPRHHSPEITAKAIGHAMKTAHNDKIDFRLLISNPGINTVHITSDRKGQVIIGDTHRHIALERSDLWIPDYPVPLDIKSSANQLLCFRPAENGRIHVSTGKHHQTGRFLMIPAALAAAAIYIDLKGIAAALTASVIYNLLNRRFP